MKGLVKALESKIAELDILIKDTVCKFSWHRLDINPEDLPPMSSEESNESVDVFGVTKDNKTPFVCYYDYENRCWWSYGEPMTSETHVEVVAWFEVPEINF